LLTAAFGGGVEEENAPKTAAKVRESSYDPVERTAAYEDVPEASAPAAGRPSLTWNRTGEQPHAVYRLQRGEALYSSVAIRFTGRLHANDVNDVLARIVKFNEIEDVSKLPVGYAVKIPMELLLPEYLPDDDPARLAWASGKRESQRATKRTRAAGLSGVHVIIDAGHGGRDVGTEHDDVWESTYVYDVASRLKQVLEKNTGAKVTMTTRSKERGFTVPDRDVLQPLTDHYVQTTPKYLLDDAIIGVNLRWYLANSAFRKAVRAGAKDEKVIFISLHADSLHPSLRGAMAYIPGARYVTGSYSKKGKIYLARSEVREQPTVKHTRAESLAAEGLSRELAESIIEAFQENDLKVHPFAPVRDNVIRHGKEWVPAVIRHNEVPTRLLLELCNLGNRKDRELIQTRKFRQQLAEAVFEGIVEFFASDRDEAPGVLAAGAR
jgi:N-acetylmuramoyl-L-alanine amidase